MDQTKETNRKFVLNSRPKGAPVPENFRIENTPVPTPDDGQVLLRTVYLSLDPSIKVLFMSGYSADIIAERGVLEHRMSLSSQNPFHAAIWPSKCTTF